MYKSKSRQGSILVILAALCWSTMGIFGRTLSSIGLASSQTAQIRVTAAFLTISIFLLIKDRTLFHIHIKDLWCFIGTGICSLMMYCICYFKALETANISVVTVLSYMSPIYIMLMGAVLFREKITGRKIVALAMSICGCVLVSGIIYGIKGDTAGLLLALASGFFYALYSIFTKFAINRGYTTWTILLYTFGFAMIGCSFMCDWGNLASVVSADAKVLLLFILFGVVTCLVPYALYSRGLQSIELSKASILNCLDIVSSSIFGAVFFSEYPTWTAILGIVLVMGAVVLLSIPEKTISR